MKTIDLLNKIANGEELPNKIRWHGYIWHLTEYSSGCDYIKENDDGMIDCLFDDYILGALVSSLNDEVEVIEDNKKIEKLEYCVNLDKFKEEHLENYIRSLICFINGLKEKTNEIIEVLNDKD